MATDSKRLPTACTVALRWASADWQFVSYPTVPYWGLPLLKKRGMAECRRVGRRSQWRLTPKGLAAKPHD